MPMATSAIAPPTVASVIRGSTVTSPGSAASGVAGALAQPAVAAAIAASTGSVALRGNRSMGTAYPAVAESSLKAETDLTDAVGRVAAAAHKKSVGGRRRWRLRQFLTSQGGKGRPLA